MKKNRLVALVAVTAILAATAMGCEQKSEFEKDAEKAAKKMEEAMK